jgi:hypothetical protein
VNKSGKFGTDFKKGKLIKKLIPEMQYFISTCICAEEEQGDFRLKGFKQIRINDVIHVMSYRKMRQVIYFLQKYHIIELKHATKFIIVNSKQFVIDAKYFRLLKPYDGINQIFEIELNVKKKVTVNPKAKYLIDVNAVIRQQFQLCSSYDFNAEQAKIFANELHNAGIKNDRQFVSMLDYIERLRKHSVTFNYNEKTDRIFTIINLCHKELRQYFRVKRDDKFSGFVELDFSTFNIQVLHKLVDDSISISSTNEKLVVELKTMAAWLKEDFYSNIQEISAGFDIEISRDDAKELALKHWQNARIDSWNKETGIMRTLFPEVTKVMNKLKGRTYPDYLKYSNNFMRIESQLAQEILSAFISRFPDAIIYNIFDSFMVEEQCKENLRIIMEDCSKIYFDRDINIKEK